MKAYGVDKKSGELVVREDVARFTKLSVVMIRGGLFPRDSKKIRWFEYEYDAVNFQRGIQGELGKLVLIVPAEYETQLMHAVLELEGASPEFIKAMIRAIKGATRYH